MSDSGLFCCLTSVLLLLVHGSVLAQTPPEPDSVPKSITVVMDDNYPPYIFRDANGQTQGILKDSWGLWSAHTGIAVNLQAMDWAAAQQEMLAGHADVIDTIFKTDERQHSYDFSPPYVRLDVSIFFHKSISGIVNADSLKGFSVGVKEGDACIDELRHHGVAALQRYPNYSALITAAAANSVRVFCMDEAPAVYLLNQHGLARDFMHSKAIYSGEFHRAVSKGNMAMLRLVDDGFSKITELERQQIEEKWMGSAIHGLENSAYYFYGRYVLLGTILAVVVLLLWNRMLSLRVRTKTAHLTDSLKALGVARQETEHALAQTKAMLENRMVGIFRVAGRCVLWNNSALEDMLGYLPGELVGVSARQFYPTEQAFIEMADHAYPAMKADRIYRAQTEFKRKDGAIIWVKLNCSVLEHASGESLWICLDITQSKLAQDSRDEALRRLQKLTNNAPGMIYQFLLRPDGSSSFPFASEVIRHIYRLSPQDVLTDSSRLLAHIHPDDRTDVDASIQESARNLTPWQSEHRVSFEDGSVRWLFGNALPERLADGSVLWHGFVTDITERRAVDERLRQFSRITEQAPIAIVITDLAGNIEYTNPYVTKVTGYGAEEVLGQNPRILHSGQTPPEVFQDLWATLKAGDVWRGEFQNQKKNGDLFVEHAVIAPVLDQDGNSSHYIALKEDVTERRRIDQALQASLLEKEALLNEVHHRVKNNLQVITSLLSLEAGRSNQPETRLVLQDMKGRIRSMALLHETLYRSGTFAAVELGSYLKQLATHAFRAQASNSSAIGLTLNLDSVTVSLDQATTCGLLVNELISNSLKHGFPQGGRGTVCIELFPAMPVDISGQDRWCLCVSDTGVGLPDDFEQRSQQSLGMQLVTDLVRQLGGTLLIRQSPGVAFEVTFISQEAKILTATALAV